LGFEEKLTVIHGISKIQRRRFHGWREVGCRSGTPTNEKQGKSLYLVMSHKAEDVTGRAV